MGDPRYVAPRRLSKPRTNKSSANLLSDQPTTPSSPHYSSDQDYFGGDAVVVNSHGECRSRSKSRVRIRAYLYGSSHDVLQTSSDEDETQTGIAGAAREVRKRLSRTASSIMPLPSAKVSATRLSNSSSSGLLSTCSTESQERDPEESAMIADQIKRRAYHDSLAARNHVSTSVDEDKHVDSFMAPLRRKSLYTPGIATRNASDILRKPSKPSTDQHYYYDHSRPETSPLSQLASLNVGEDGRSTPCDLHYLGGLQLGTLRVTNGASSPVPREDLAYRSATPESKTHDEYYTASEGSLTGDRDPATPLPPRGGSPLKNESKITLSMGTEIRGPSSPDVERELSNESFPFSREKTDSEAHFEGRTTDHKLRLGEGTLDASHLEAMEPINLLDHENEAPDKILSSENEYFEWEKSKESLPSKIRSPQSCLSDGGTFDESSLFKSEISNEVMRFEKESLSESLPSKTSSLGFQSVQERKPDECFPFGERSSEGASGIADEYIAELEGSPFSHSSLEGKMDIVPHSNGSAKEMWRAIINDVEVQHAGKGSSSREDALRKLTVNGNMPSTSKLECLSVPPSQPSRHSASLEMPQTDSGYFSYASLTGAPTDEGCFEIVGDSISPTKVAASSQPQVVETVRSSARSSFRVPIRKLKKERPKSLPPPVNLIAGHHELTDANIPRVPSIIAARHAKRLSQFPLLEHTFPSSQHTTANRAWSPVQAHDAPIRFPSPANALEAASAPLESFPTASSRPRASTIVIDGDDWVASDLVRSPSWSEFGGGRRKKEQKNLAKEERRVEKRLLKEEKELERRLQKGKKDLEKQKRKDDNKQKSTRSRSASRTRARSSEGQSRHDELVTIADFGTVTESLGNSPYDIATPTFPNPQIARHWHPHQISTAMLRPKSPFSARTHSQTMFLDMPSVPALAAIDLKAHNLEWARNRQRSQSSSVARVESFNDRGGIPGKVIQPHGVTMEVMPPLPAFPSANQVKRGEAEIIRSRPNSMIGEAPLPNPTSQDTEGNIAMPYPSEPGTSAPTHKTKSSQIVPDLWSNGSLERKSPRNVEESKQEYSDFVRGNDKAIPVKDNLWETQSNAWSQRRKSAGEALLRSQVKDVLDGQEAANPTVRSEHNERPISLDRASTFGTSRTFVPTPSRLDPFPHPLASHPQLTTQQPTSASNTTGSHNRSTIEQSQRHGFASLATFPRPSMPFFQHEEQTSTPTSFRTQAQSFQIQRKRVGSGPSNVRSETAIRSSLYEGVLV